MRKPYKPPDRAPKDLCGAVFRAPNDSEGREFLRLADKFLCRPQFSMRTRGRGSRKDVPNAGQEQISFRDGTSGAVYIYRNWHQEALKITCPNCGGDYERVDDYAARKWRVTRLCLICEKGQKDEKTWRKSHFVSGEMV